MGVITYSFGVHQKKLNVRHGSVWMLKRGMLEMGRKERVLHVCYLSLLERLGKVNRGRRKRDIGNSRPFESTGHRPLLVQRLARRLARRLRVGEGL